MQDFINMVTGKLGVGEGEAKSAVGSLLSLIRKEGDSDAAETLLDRLPGANALADEAEGGGSGGGLLGGITGALGMGGGGGGAGLGGLLSSGLSLDKIKDLVPMFVDYAKKIAGEDVVNKVIGSVPALKSLI